MLNRREFLKRLGFTIAALPLAGFKPKEDEVLDVVEIDAAVEEDKPEELPHDGKFDQPYSMGPGWLYAVWSDNSRDAQYTRYYQPTNWDEE